MKNFLFALALAICSHAFANVILPVYNNPVQSCSSITYPARSGGVYNITFTFNTSYRCGRYANGDWWVAPASSGGTVTITAMTPYGANANRDGAMLNPASINTQGFDSTANVTYDAALNKMGSLPLAVAGGNTVVKVSSIYPTAGVSGTHSADSRIAFNAALTVLDVPLSNSHLYFRPAYTTGPKTTYPISNINYSLFGTQAAQNVVNGVTPYETAAYDAPGFLTPAPQSWAASTFPSVLVRFNGVRMDHMFGDPARSLQAVDTMPNYGADISNSYSVYLLRMMVNDFTPTTNALHQLMAIQYLQAAIDLQQEATNGVLWNATGGLSIGRKLPLAFASIALPSYASDFTSAIAASSFDENNLLSASPINSKVLYGVYQNPPDFGYWNAPINDTGARDAKDPYFLIDGGESPVLDDPTGGYQYCCVSKPFKSTVLASYISNADTPINAANLFVYAERWVGYGYITNSDTCAPYDDVPANYHVTYGSTSGTSGSQTPVCITGAGRAPSINNTQADQGLYRSYFSDGFWSWYQTQPGHKTTPYTP